MAVRASTPARIHTTNVHARFREVKELGATWTRGEDGPQQTEEGKLLDEVFNQPIIEPTVWGANQLVNTNHSWTTFHQQYPKAQLEFYRYGAHEYVGPEMFELEVFKMLQEYEINVRFRGTKLHTLEGAQVTPIAVAAVKRVRPFLFRLLN